MRWNEPLTKDGVVAAVLFALAAIASIVGMVLALLGFLRADDEPKREEDRLEHPPPIERQLVRDE